MNKTPIFLLVAVGLVILIAGSYAPEEYETTRMEITGMHCNNCAEKIETTLNNLEGISNASVDFENGIAEIVYNPSTVNLTTISTAIIDLGFNGGTHKECDFKKEEMKKECLEHQTDKSSKCEQKKKNKSI